MKDSKPKQIIEIEGVFLTEDALKTIKNLQENNNQQLKSDLLLIDDTVCLLGKLLKELDDSQTKEATTIMAALGDLKKSLKSFKKL